MSQTFVTTWRRAATPDPGRPRAPPQATTPEPQLAGVGRWSTVGELHALLRVQQRSDQKKAQRKAQRPPRPQPSVPPSFGNTALPGLDAPTPAPSTFAQAGGSGSVDSGAGPSRRSSGDMSDVAGAFDLLTDVVGRPSREARPSAKRRIHDPLPVLCHTEAVRRARQGLRTCQQREAETATTLQAQEQAERTLVASAFSDGLQRMRHAEATAAAARDAAVDAELTVRRQLLTAEANVRQRLRAKELGRRRRAEHVAMVAAAAEVVAVEEEEVDDTATIGPLSTAASLGRFTTDPAFHRASSPAVPRRPLPPKPLAAQQRDEAWVSRLLANLRAELRDGRRPALNGSWRSVGSTRAEHAPAMDEMSLARSVVQPRGMEALPVSAESDDFPAPQSGVGSDWSDTDAEAEAEDAPHEAPPDDGSAEVLDWAAPAGRSPRPPRLRLAPGSVRMRHLSSVMTRAEASPPRRERPTTTLGPWAQTQQRTRTSDGRRLKRKPPSPLYTGPTRLPALGHLGEFYRSQVSAARSRASQRSDRTAPSPLPRMDLSPTIDRGPARPGTTASAAGSEQRGRRPLRAAVFLPLVPEGTSALPPAFVGAPLLLRSPDGLEAYTEPAPTHAATPQHRPQVVFYGRLAESAGRHGAHDAAVPPEVEAVQWVLEGVEGPHVDCGVVGLDPAELQRTATVGLPPLLTLGAEWTIDDHDVAAAAGDAIVLP